MSLFKKLFGGGSSDNAGETPEFKALLDASMEELKLKTAGHQGGWRLGQSKRPAGSGSVAHGDLIFTTLKTELWPLVRRRLSGALIQPRARGCGRGQIHPINDALKRDSLRVKDYGQQHKIARLITAEWPCTEADAWAMAALACKLCQAQGVYRGPAGTTFVFISFGKVQLTKKQ